MSLHGIRTVALLELRRRQRALRWPVLVIGVWVLIITAIGALTWWAVRDQPDDRGTALYEVTLFFVLALGMLVVPSLTATSVNGDRERGVLATMQTTLLTSADIVVGKLVAAWAITFAFLLAASPLLVWVWIVGGVEIGRMLLTITVLAFVLAVICALGLMFSTVTARTATSAVLTYLSVTALIFGTVIAFFLSVPLTWTQESARVKVVPESWYEEHPANPAQGSPVEPTPADCVFITQERTNLHTERTWWLLALNPFVVVADAASARKLGGPARIEPLQLISQGARTARMGTAPDPLNQCLPELKPNPGGSEQQRQLERLSRVQAVWPYGLVFLGVLGAASTWVAIRRLQTPIRNPRRSTPIA